MEILYLWIKQYRNIENQGFNFSSEYFFDFDYKSNGISVLDFKQNENYIKDFFELKNIVNITAIIGRNGSGKTSIFDFIKEYLTEGGRFIDTKCLVIIREDERKKELDNLKDLTVLYHDDIKFDMSEHLNSLAQTLPYNIGYHSSRFSSTSFIYYSNIFDLKKEVEYEGLVNISTNYLLKTDKENNALVKDLDVSEIDLYYFYEILRNLEFIYDFKAIDLPFRLPDKLYMCYSNEDRKYLEKLGKEDKRALEFTELMKNLEKEDLQYVDDPEVYFYYRLCQSILYNFIRVYEISINWHDLLTVLFKIKRRNFLEMFEEFISILNSPPRIPDTQSINIKSFVDFAKIFLPEQIYLKDFSGLIIDLKKTDKKLILDFFDKFLNSMLLNSYLIFEWRDDKLSSRTFSSGEQSMLSLFSRIYHAKNNFRRKSSILNDNIVLLIDEGDLYFHPEWQRKYFQNLLSIIKLIFELYKVQVIISTNSPFLLSELPKSNVIFLDVEDGYTKALSSVNNREETFASNIYELYSDAFFMSDGLTGGFAEYKIKRIFEEINSLNQENINEEKLLNIRRQIKIIGEKIIKNQLNQMLSAKLMQIQSNR